MLAPAAFPAFFLTLLGFLLFLLVSLSVPHIKTIYLLRLNGPANIEILLGVFGACYSGGSVSFLGFSNSGINGCTASQVGYGLDPNLFGDFGGDAPRFVIRTLAAALLLNAITAGLAGFSLIWSFFAWCCSSRPLSIVTFLTLLLASLAGWIAFALNLALAIIARNRVEDYTNDNITGTLGNAIWMSLGGAIALTLAICAAGCGVFGRYSGRNRAVAQQQPAMTEAPRRRWP